MFVEVQKVVMETPEDSQVHAETSPTAGVIRTDTLTLTSSSCLASDSTHVWRGGQFEESKASMNPGQDSTPTPLAHKMSANVGLRSWVMEVVLHLIWTRVCYEVLSKQNL